MRAFELAGARAETVHLDALGKHPERLREYDLIGFPGGFSYGDDVASGRIKSVYSRVWLLEELIAARDRGVPIIGICNGFQVLVQLGLLPALDGAAPCVALCENNSGRFRDDWATIEVNEDSPCVWTRGLREFEDPALRVFPYAHGEGRLVAKDSATLGAIKDRNLDALRTAEDINGSEDRITGLCDETGRVFGLMPHPERFLDWNRHPSATRLDPSVRSGITPGLSIFTSAVGAVNGAARGVGV